MDKELLVYDEFKQLFRKLNKTNYNDDIIIGTVFFTRGAIKVLEKYCHICGYVLIENNSHEYFPVDIHEEEIVLFEGSYNCLPDKLKTELIQYNLHTRPKAVWSPFFFQWQFMCDWNVFDKHGSFFKLCSNILGKESRLNIFLEQEKSIVFPSSYEELCVLTQIFHNIFDIDFFDPEYVDEYNYVVDALLNNYHLRMEKFDIEKYCYQVCRVVNTKWEE